MAILGRSKSLRKANEIGPPIFTGTDAAPREDLYKLSRCNTIPSPRAKKFNPIINQHCGDMSPRLWPKIEPTERKQNIPKSIPIIIKEDVMKETNILVPMESPVEVYHLERFDDSMIGIALGSPHRQEWTPPLSKASCEYQDSLKRSPSRSIAKDTSDWPTPKTPKSSKWRTFFGKKTEKPTQPFYQLDQPQPALRTLPSDKRRSRALQNGGRVADRNRIQARSKRASVAMKKRNTRALSAAISSQTPPRSPKPGVSPKPPPKDFPPNVKLPRVLSPDSAFTPKPLSTPRSATTPKSVSTPGLASTPKIAAAPIPALLGKPGKIAPVASTGTSKSAHLGVPAIVVPTGSLNVEIPKTEFERYSVMFSEVLQTRNGRSSTLLARRQENGNNRLLKPIDNITVNTQTANNPRLSRVRRATSPAKSPSFSLSLFPLPGSSHASSRRSSFGTKRPLKRAQTAPAASPTFSSATHQSVASVPVFLEITTAALADKASPITSKHASLQDEASDREMEAVLLKPDVYVRVPVSNALPATSTLGADNASAILANTPPSSLAHSPGPKPASIVRSMPSPVPASSPPAPPQISKSTTSPLAPTLVPKPWVSSLTTLSAPKLKRAPSPLVQSTTFAEKKVVSPPPKELRSTKSTTHLPAIKTSTPLSPTESLRSHPVKTPQSAQSAPQTFSNTKLARETTSAQSAVFRQDFATITKPPPPLPKDEPRIVPPRKDDPKLRSGAVQVIGLARKVSVTRHRPSPIKTEAPKTEPLGSPEEAQRVRERLGVHSPERWGVPKGFTPTLIDTNAHQRNKSQRVQIVTA